MVEAVFLLFFLSLKNIIFFCSVFIQENLLNTVHIIQMLKGILEKESNY